MAKPETIFRSRIRKRLEELPNCWWESIQQRSILGTPDIIGCVNGTFVGLELKARPDSPVSEMQSYKLKKIALAGGLGFIVHPDNFEKTYELLKHLATETHDDKSHTSTTEQPASEQRTHGSSEAQARPDVGLPG